MPHPFLVVLQMLGYLRARPLSMHMLIILSLTVSGTVNADAAPATIGGEHRIVLFGARWCAPCMAEYRSLSEIIAAATPDHVVLAWVEKPIAVPVSLEGIVETLSAQEAQRLAMRCSAMAMAFLGCAARCKGTGLLDMARARAPGRHSPPLGSVPWRRGS